MVEEKKRGGGLLLIERSMNSNLKNEDKRQRSERFKTSKNASSSCDHIYFY